MRQLNVAAKGFANPWVCTQCGVCSAVCPTGAIRMIETRNGCRYPSVNEADCVSCGICSRICPGPTTVGSARPPRPTETDRPYGPFVGAVLAHAADPEVQLAAASGGIATALLTSLMRRDLIHGAVVAYPGQGTGTVEMRLARTPDEIAAAMGSKYAPSCLADALQSIAADDRGSFAVVGLPCQMNAVCRAGEHVGWASEKLALRISLFCAGTKDLRYRSFLLRRMGVTDEQVADFAYRSAGWPGVPSVKLRDGAELRLDDPAVFGGVWSKAAFTPPRCLLCDDPLGYAADIVVGDPWRLDYAAADHGQTLVILRTPRGEKAIREAESCGDIVVTAEVPPEDVMRSARGTLWRRHYAPARRSFASLWARAWRDGASERGSVGLAAKAKAFATLARSVMASAIYGRSRARVADNRGRR